MTVWLDFDREQMRSRFNAEAFGFRHRLHESPLFELPRLAQLADFLFAAGGRRDVYNAAAAKRFDQAFEVNGSRPLSPGEAINTIETSNSWMVLKRVERDPEFAVIVQECMQQLAEDSPVFAPGNVVKCEGFIFVTSPGGLTPYHIDPQWSFIAQIRGRKRYRIYDVRDPSVVSADEIERYYLGETMAARYDPAKDRAVKVFDLQPGMCANQPLHAPHSAEVFAEASISMTIALVLREWEQAAHVHRANHYLRKAGLNPGPVGARPLSDSVKRLAYRATRKLARVAGVPDR